MTNESSIHLVDFWLQYFRRLKLRIISRKCTTANFLQTLAKPPGKCKVVPIQQNREGAP